MREIKFRAWLKEHKSMKDVMEIDIDNQTIFYYWFGDHDGHFENFNKIDLMQYTGLEDKNNKEIYEGDIVKLRANHGIGVVKYYDEWGAFVVEYVKSKPLAVLGMHYYKEDIEILGNIYENPELMEE